jgi:hypothetical protein
MVTLSMVTLSMVTLSMVTLSMVTLSMVTLSDGGHAHERASSIVHAAPDGQGHGHGHKTFVSASTRKVKASASVPYALTHDTAEVPIEPRDAHMCREHYNAQMAGFKLIFPLIDALFLQLFLVTALTF